jgi:hypothetical protein
MHVPAGAQVPPGGTGFHLYTTTRCAGESVNSDPVVESNAPTTGEFEKADGTLKIKEMTNEPSKQQLTKSQRKNAAKRARAKGTTKVGRPTYTAYLKGKRQMNIMLTSFPGLDQSAGSWMIHSLRLKYIDSQPAPEGLVTLQCGGKMVVDQAGKSPQLWITTPSRRIASDAPAAVIVVGKAHEKEFVVEVSITATTYPM